MVNTELKKTWKIYFNTAKEKKYKKETTKVLGMLALSKKSVAHFGSSKAAFEKLISLVNTYDEDKTFKIFTDEIGV